MRFLFIVIVNLFFSVSAITCDFFEAEEQDNVQSLMGKKSKMYDAYKQGKCILENALQPLTNEQRKIIANLIAKSYSQAE